jgi:hypothetical protein
MNTKEFEWNSMVIVNRKETGWNIMVVMNREDLEGRILSHSEALLQYFSRATEWNYECQSFLRPRIYNAIFSYLTTIFNCVIFSASTVNIKQYGNVLKGCGADMFRRF